ncbi:hypothetical protein [Spirillospora sp. NBC_01491]|uniref:hypothetical protein n=1 Tax=Spirillospora sp. NBC_01491 TaxID=2976007 RepID=UPI002E2FD227|nr:hypothetical protein [Spirillospora sp. NBC_01491]
MTTIKRAGRAAARLAGDPPDWLVRLRADPGAAALGVAWPDESALREEAEREEEHVSDGIMHTDATIGHVREHRPHMLRVASGPGYAGTNGFEHEAAWFVDTREPDGLLLAPSASYPTFLWIPAGTTVDGMRGALGGLFPTPRPTRVTLPKTARGFLGYAHQIGVPNVYDGTFGPIDGLELDRYYTMNTFTEVQSWGSAILDDPSPDEALSPLQAMARFRECREQSPGVPSMTWRTSASGSYVSIEAHMGRIFVAEARYRPNPNPEVIERMNAEFGSAFPTDLPVDVVGALIGFDFQTLEVWERELAVEEDPGHVLGKMEIAVALAHGDLDAAERLRPHFAHRDPGVRAPLMTFALNYNLEFLLEELLLTEPDEQMAEQVHRILDRGTGDAHRDLFEEGADWGDEDEDEDGDDE